MANDEEATVSLYCGGSGSTGLVPLAEAKRQVKAMKWSGGKPPSTDARANTVEEEDISDLIPKARSHVEIWAQFNKGGKINLNARTIA